MIGSASIGVQVMVIKYEKEERQKNKAVGGLRKQTKLGWDIARECNKNLNFKFKYQIIAYENNKLNRGKILYNKSCIDS